MFLVKTNNLICFHRWVKRGMGNICIYMCVCVYIHIYMYVCIYIYVLLYIYIYIHTHTHIYMFFLAIDVAERISGVAQCRF